MDAIHHVAPEVPFFLEGTGQSGIGANWGDGFATDAQLIRDHGLSDPNHFFQVILLLFCKASWVEEGAFKSAWPVLLTSCKTYIAKTDGKSSKVR